MTWRGRGYYRHFSHLARLKRLADAEARADKVVEQNAVAAAQQPVWAPVLVELLSEVTEDEVTREYRASAKVVHVSWCTVDAEGRYAGFAWKSPTSKQRYVAVGRDVEVFFPALSRREANHPWSLRSRPNYIVGQRLWAVFVNGRWECVGDYVPTEGTVYVGEVLEDRVVYPLSRNIQVDLRDRWHVPGTEVTAYCALAPFICRIWDPVWVVKSKNVGNQDIWLAFPQSDSWQEVAFVDEVDNRERVHDVRLPFNVMIKMLTFCPDGKDTSYFRNDHTFVHRYGLELANEYVFPCAQPFYDDKIGTRKLVLDDVPRLGWRVVETYVGKFMKIDVVGGILGGTSSHTHTAQPHTHDLGGSGNIPNVGGLSQILSANVVIDEASHEPPYVTVRLIERFK